MSAYFVDTSALLKRYVIEIGSVWVQNWIQPNAGNVTVVSDLTPVEVFSVLMRHQRNRRLRSTIVARIQATFLGHFEKEYFSVLIDASLLEQARLLVVRYPLRSPDAIQLASAIRAKSLLNLPIIFVSGDKELLAAASAEGFAIDDPNAHP